MMREIVTALMLFLPLNAVFCQTSVPAPASSNSDYKTEGFIDNNFFRVIVTGEPDRNLKGLVARRENSLQKARGKIQARAVEVMSEFYIGHRCRAMNIDKRRIENLDEIRRHINDKLTGIIMNGNISHEYYNEDCSAVVVYGISMNNLQREIESIKIQFKLLEEVKQ